MPRNSDHATFLRRDIPILGFFTGLHGDYHGVRDHADKLDFERMADITELGSNVVDRLANMDEDAFPRFRAGGFLGIQHARVGKSERRRWRLDDDEGVRVERVLDDSPARTAGLKRGDILVRLDGRPLHHDNIVDRLGGIGAGVEIEIELLRDGEPQRVRLTLARRPDGG